MKLFYLLNYTFLLFISACSGPKYQESSEPEKTAEIQDIVLVDQVLANPDVYVDKKIKVEGMVSHVCKHSGKRMHLTSKYSSKMIRVEASEGIDRFEREIEGSDIIVEGVMHRQLIDEAYLARWENEGLEGEGVHLEHNSAEAEEKEEQIRNMRKQLQESGKNQMVSLWIDGNSLQVKP